MGVTCSLFCLVSQSPNGGDSPSGTLIGLYSRTREKMENPAGPFTASLTERSSTHFSSARIGSLALCDHLGVWKVSSAAHSSSERECNIGEY